MEISKGTCCELEIFCFWCDDSTKIAGITLARAQALLNREGGYREKHAKIDRMKNEYPRGGNAIDCYAADGTHLAQIAYRGTREGWFICG